MDKPKILILTSSYPRFAGDFNGHFIHSLAKELSNTNRVFILAPWDGTCPRFEVSDGITISRHRQFLWNVDFAYGDGLFEKVKRNKLLLFVVPFFLFFQLVGLVRICRNEKIDLINPHWAFPSGFSATVFKLFNKRIKVVTTIHGSDFWHIGKSPLVKFVFRHADGITVVNKAISNRLKALGYTMPKLICPMGVDVSRFKYSPGNQVKSGYTITGPVILYVGILVESKGLLNLVEAFSKLVIQRPDVTLLIIGDGELKERLKELTTSLKIDDKVIMTGNLKNDELPAYYNASNLLVLPSFSEGWPMVVMEAQCAGLPCVVTDIPAFEGLTEDDGFITVPVNDSVKLEEALFRNLKPADEVKQKIAERARNIYSWHSIASKFDGFFNMVLNEREGKTVSPASQY